MASVNVSQFRVSPRVLLHFYYLRESRTWWAYYTNNTGDQLGHGWFGPTRDDVLIFRPATPEN